MPMFGINFPWDQPVKLSPLNLQHQPVDEAFKKILMQYNTDGSETLALVLNGGGLLGADEFGRIYRLWELGVLRHCKMIVGTSVGALNALLTAKYINDMDTALGIWAGITKNSDVYAGALETDFTHVFGHIWATVTGAKSLLDPANGFYKIIEREFTGMQINSFDGYRVITTASRLKDGADLVYDGAFDAVCCAKMSSAMFPGFPAVAGPDGLCIDGGLGNNMPVGTAIERGATKVILIGTSPDKVPAAEPKNNIVDVAKCLLPNIMAKFEERVWAWVNEYQDDPTHEKVEILASYPKRDRGNPLSAKETHDRIRAGYAEACVDFTPEAVSALLLG